MAAATVLLAVLVSVPADAAAPKVRGAATITSCGGEGLTLAMSLKGDRRVRGAELRVSWMLAGLFKGMRKGPETKLGKKRSATGTQAFDGLPADVYSGVIRYRWLKGRKTVAAGTLRTRPAKVAGRRGVAFCTLRVGRPPEDHVPPVVFIAPEPAADWVRAPIDGVLGAFDDFSGVAEVAYTVDGGPVQRGRRFALTTDGTHTVVYAARDVAGNVSEVKQAVYRVDAGPPSAPAVTAPTAGAVTGDTTPDVTWSGSTDGGSGVRSYTLLVRSPAGAIVYSKTVPENARSATIDQPLADGAYTAQVIATDGTTPEPYHSGSPEVGFTIDPLPYSNNFSGGCGDFSDPDPWQCTGEALKTVNPVRCHLGGGDRTYTATSSTVTLKGAGPFTVSYALDFREPSNMDDTGAVKAFVDGGGSAAASKSYNGTFAGSDSFSVNAQQSVRLEVEHKLRASPLFTNCVADQNASFSIDDLRVVRNN